MEDVDICLALTEGALDVFNIGLMLNEKSGHSLQGAHLGLYKHSESLISSYKAL